MAGTIGNNLPRIKVSNQSAIREVVYKFGPISRMDISQRLNLTFPTITTNINLMIAEGLMEESDKENSGGRGRKTMLVDFNPSSRLFLGVEMRRHASYAVIVDLRGNTISYKKRSVFHDGYEESLSEACSLALEMMEESSITWSMLSGFGLCLPGIVDPENGVLEIHPRFKWKEKNVREDVKRRTGTPLDVTVVNNTCARVYGASLFEHTVFKGADHAAYMYVGTGIKCPLVFSLRNHFGQIVGEGEVGHMVMNPQGPQCACGNHGCLESYASESAIVSAATKAAEEGRSELLKSLYMDHSLTFDDILYAEEQGDKETLEIVGKAVEYLSLAIANINNFVKPECVVVDCRLFVLEENRRMLEEDVKRNLSWSNLLDYDLSYIESKEDSGARGAAAAAIRDNLQIFIE